MVLAVEDRDVFLGKIAGLRKELDDKQRKAKDYRRYINEARLYADVPRDQFSHSYKLIFHPKIEASKLSELFDPDIMLSNIRDPLTLILYQNDFDLLSKFFDMGQRCKGIMDFFSMLFYPWLGQIRMTSALGGVERWMQGFMEPVQAPYEGFSYAEKQQANKQRKTGNLNIMDRVKSFSGETRWGSGDKKLY